MKNRKRIRQKLLDKAILRIHKLKFVLNIKFILEEKGIQSKGKSFEDLVDYVLRAPVGLEKC